MKKIILLGVLALMAAAPAWAADENENQCASGERWDSATSTCVSDSGDMTGRSSATGSAVGGASSPGSGTGGGSSF